MSLSFRELAVAGSRGTAVLAASCLTVLPVFAMAQQQLGLDVEMTTFYASNPFLLPGDEGAAGWELAAKSDAVWLIGPRTSLQSEGAVGFRQYSQRYGNFVTGRGAGILQHRYSEYLSVRAEAYHERVLPTEALADSIDSAIDPLSIRRNSYLSSALTWNPDARTSVTGAVAWTRIDPSQSSILKDTTAIEYTVGVERRVDPFFSLGVKGQFTSSRSAFGDSSLKAFRLTASRRLGGRWQANANLGIDQETTTLRGSPIDSSPVRLSGEVSICQQPERMQMCLTAAMRSVVSGLGTVERESSAGVSVTRQTSEQGSLSASASYVRGPIGQIAGPTEDEKASALRLSATYYHQVSRRSSLQAGLRYLRRVQAGGDAIDSMVVQAGIVFKERRR